MAQPHSTVRPERKGRQGKTLPLDQPAAGPPSVYCRRRDLRESGVLRGVLAVTGSARPAQQLAIVTGQAAAGGQLELPAVQLAGEPTVAHRAEAHQVRLQMRAV